MAPRVTYRRTCSYNTGSNKIKKVKTPGGRVLAQHVIKKANRPKCALCPRPLSGIPALRAHSYRAISRRQRRVSRPYGGNVCGICLKEKIMRAFLIEEVKIVKRVMATQKKESKQ